jgi:hypothetical protein
MADKQLIQHEELRRLYAARPAAKAVLDHFASRQRDRTETTVDRLYELLLAEGKSLTRTEVVHVFRQLHGIGAGVFVIGRKGHPSRFRWAVSATQLARAAAGEDMPVDLAIRLESPRERSEVIAHRFVLRPAFTVSFQLPSDLSSTEAARLSDFIRTLPFTS